MGSVYVSKVPPHLGLMAPSDRLDKLSPKDAARYMLRVTRHIFRQAHTRGVLGGAGAGQEHAPDPARKQQQPQQEN